MFLSHGSLFQQNIAKAICDSDGKSAGDEDDDDDDVIMTQEEVGIKCPYTQKVGYIGGS